MSLIKADSLEKSYGDVDALNGINLEVDKG